MTDGHQSLRRAALSSYSGHDRKPGGIHARLSSKYSRNQPRRPLKILNALGAPWTPGRIPQLPQ